MPVVRTTTAPTFTIGGFHLTGLTAPSRGASELCTWRLEIEPHAKSEAHRSTFFCSVFCRMPTYMAEGPFYLAENDAAPETASCNLRESEGQHMRQN